VHLTDLPQEARDRLEGYLALLTECARQFNLTAIREPEAIRVRHFEDSLRLLEAADFSRASVLDIGAGAGFPGLVLALACPGAHVTALDATGKKVDFMRRAAGVLGLSNVTCLHARAEELAHDARYRESFAIAVSRGVAALPALCELSLPFVRVGGWMLAMKERAEDCAAAARFGGALRDPFAYTLPGGIEHTVIRVRKIGETPPRFPRPWRQIRKQLTINN